MNVIILGLDAFEPATFERLYEQGRMPNLGKYVTAGGYSRFAVSNPPQSEVSWTSIATGLNPGGHGVFDFVHRDPTTYALSVSLLPTKRGFGGIHFAPPYTARTIFDQAVEQGYPATALWWPAMFPAQVQSPVRSLPGLGTPDILGRLGVGTYFSSSGNLIGDKERKTPEVVLTQHGSDRYSAALSGPMRKKRGHVEAVTQGFELELATDQSAHLKIGRQKFELQLGQWSPIVELSFKVGLFFSVRALTRFILTQLQPDVSLYALPLQLHPLRSPWHYATPPGFVKQVWQACGPFLTLGWPQDTTALEENYISDGQFLDLCDSICRTREKVLMHQIDQFHEGILASVFDTLDRVQHMFWRDRPDIIEEWYVKMDAMVGRVEERLFAKGLKEKTRIVVVSDHGFTDFNYKVHLNRWLVERGYLVSQENGATGDLHKVDWSKSQAYAIGLNSIYLNLAGREGQGSVQGDQKQAVLDKLCNDLLQWQGPDGQPVVRETYPQDVAFDGALAEFGPDIVVGFSPGYRASQQTGLGAWNEKSLERNYDHWGADHCIDPDAVPGVLFSSQGVTDFPNPSYKDIPAITIEAMPDPDSSGPPPTFGSDEDEKIVEERLRSLGYL